MVGWVQTSVVSPLGILLGRTTARDRDLGALLLSGDAVPARTMERWLHISDHAAFDGVRPLSDEGPAVVPLGAKGLLDGSPCGRGQSR